MALIRRLRARYNSMFHRSEVNAKLMGASMTREGDSDTWKMQAVYDAPALMIVADECRKLLEKGNAPNFVSIELFDKATMKSYIVTVQREERPAPQEIIAGLRKALETIAGDDLDNLNLIKQSATSMLEIYGYR